MDPWLLLLSILGVRVVHGEVHLCIPQLLAVDDEVNYTVELGPVTKFSGNPLFGEFGSKGGKPWELAWWNTYPTVARDEASSKFKMWYNGFVNCSDDYRGFCPNKNYPKDVEKTLNFHGRMGATFYAESEDGKNWTKPALGLVSWNGSMANNIVFTTDGDPNRGVFLDAHERNASQRFKAFGSFGKVNPGVMVSPDGIHWDTHHIASASSMHVAADTANNALWDASLGRYLAFSRTHCRSNACNRSGWGDRRETRSVSATWMDNNWTKGIEISHGEAGYEMYSLVPWRLPSWAPGVYLGVGSFYSCDTHKPDFGNVYCELMSSDDHGQTWVRLAPHKPIIPLGPKAAFDSHTCYAAPPLPNPSDAGASTLMYYAGGDGPHSGPRRSDYMALAVAEHSHAMAGFRADGFGAAINTKPLRWLAATHPRLRVTYRALAAEASIVAKVMDRSGRLLASARFNTRLQFTTTTTQIQDQIILLDPVDTQMKANVGLVSLNFQFEKVILFSFEFVQ